MINKKYSAGFTLVEVIVAIALSVIFVPAIIKLISFASAATSQGERYTQAYSYAQEALEAIYYIKTNDETQWDWKTTPVNTTPGEYYQPDKVSGVWKLGAKTTNPVVTRKPFTRKVEIKLVRRCGDEICNDPGASPDSFTRLITVYVTWPSSPQDEKIILNAYVTQH